MFEDTDEEREEREDSVDASEIMDSGDDVDEAERAKEERRATGGQPSNEPLVLEQKLRGGRWSRVDRAIPTFCA